MSSERSSTSRHKITSALQVIRKNAVYRSIATRLAGNHGADTPKKCKKLAAAASSSSSSVASVAADDGGFGDWRTEGLPEHSHRRPSPPCVVPRSVSDYGVVHQQHRPQHHQQPQRPTVRRQHVSDTKRVEEAYRRGFCDGSVADVFLMRQQTAAGRRRRPSSADLSDCPPWTRLSSSCTVPAGLGGGSGGIPSSKSRVVTAAATHHKSLPSSTSRYQRHRRLSLPVSSATEFDSVAAGYSSGSASSSIEMESPSTTVPTKAAAIALHQLIECYRNGYRVTDHKIALMLDILDTQQRLAKVKGKRLGSDGRKNYVPSPLSGIAVPSFWPLPSADLCYAFWRNYSSWVVFFVEKSKKITTHAF